MTKGDLNGCDSSALSPLSPRSRLERSINSQYHLKAVLKMTKLKTQDKQTSHCAHTGRPANLFPAADLFFFFILLFIGLHSHFNSILYLSGDHSAEICQNSFLLFYSSLQIYLILISRMRGHQDVLYVICFKASLSLFFLTWQYQFQYFCQTMGFAVTSFLP